MDLIDFILNVAALLLWLNWRSIRLDPFRGATPATLAGTLRRAEPARLKRWHFLAALCGVLIVRAIFYRVVGPEVSWVPQLDLFVVAPVFRGHSLWLVLLFSVLSFFRMLAVFYFWLLALAVINRHETEPDAIQKMVLLHLGRAARWPGHVQAVVPLLAGAAIWFALHPLLVYAGVMNPAQSNLHFIGRGLLVGTAIYFSLRLLLPVLLVLHMIASYVYLGRSPLWDFIGTTSKNVLAPLKRLPLRAGKVDFAPVAGILLIGLFLYRVPWISVPWFIGYFLDRHGLMLWPN